MYEDYEDITELFLAILHEADSLDVAESEFKKSSPTTTLCTRSTATGVTKSATANATASSTSAKNIYRTAMRSGTTLTISTKTNNSADVAKLCLCINEVV